MTKQHFEAIANIINADRASASEAQRVIVKGLMFSLADYFKSINPLFDRAKFYEACGF